MKVEITNKFRKQINSCMDPSLKIKVVQIIERALECGSIHDIPNLKKLKGANNCFRIKTGNYRIGVVIEKDQVIFAAFDHRSAIYTYFP